MLYFMVVWTGLLGVCLVTGCGWLHRLDTGQLIRQPAERFILSAWLGLSTLAILTLTAALFGPLSPLTGIGLALLAMAPALMSQSALRELANWWGQSFSGWRLIGYGLCGGAIAAFMSKTIDWIDTGAYHYGLIQWFSQYGVTPGLVLLNRQFGFVSAWFALAAPFNPASIEGRAGTVMNGFVLLLAALQMAIALKWILSKSADPKPSQLNHWFLLTFSLVVCGFLTQTPFLSKITVSASPDAAIALFSIAMPWSMLVVNDARQQHSLSTAHLPKQTALNIDFIPVILAAAAVSIKLTALPLLAIALGFYLFRLLTLAHWTKGILLTLILVLPFLITQTIISGYPLYPSTFLHFDFPWTRAIADVQDLAADTHGWIRWFGEPPAEANQFIWLTQKWLGSTQTSKLMGGLIVLSTLSAIHVLSSHQSRKNYAFIWLILLSAVGITFTMLKAPLFRFGMGYTFVLPILSASRFCDTALEHLNNKYLQAVSRATKPFKKPSQKINRLLAIVVLSIATVLIVQLYGSMAEQLILASPLPTVTLRQQQTNDITYTVTQDKARQCWWARLPCVASLPTQVKLRNPDIGVQGGFVLDKVSRD